MRAGLPTTTALSGTDFVTTAPAPTMAPRPIVMPGRMVAPPPDRSAGFNRRHRKGRWVLLAAWKGVVGEGDIGADEDVILDAQAIPKLHARFHRDAVADDHVVLNEDVGANVAVGADASVAEDYDELPDAGVGTNLIRLDVGCLMKLFFHTTPLVVAQAQSLHQRASLPLALSMDWAGNMNSTSLHFLSLHEPDLYIVFYEAVLESNAFAQLKLE